MASIDAWTGWWTDAIYVACSDGTELGPIPESFDGDGGILEGGICKDTVGVESIEWYRAAPNEFNPEPVLVHVTITCVGGASTTVATGCVRRDFIFPRRGDFLFSPIEVSRFRLHVRVQLPPETACV